MLLNDPLTLTFSALAHPIRRAILEQLRQGPRSVNEFALPFPVSGAAVTKHLKVLETCGLIERGRDAQYRPCRLQTKPLVAADAWIEACRAEWEGRFDRLEAYMEKIAGDGKDLPPGRAPSPGNVHPISPNIAKTPSKNKKP